MPAIRIDRVADGKRAVTAEIVLRLRRYSEYNPFYWINLQSRLDVDVAEDRLSSGP